MQEHELLTCAQRQSRDRREEQDAKGESPVEDQRVQPSRAHELRISHAEDRAHPGPATA